VHRLADQRNKGENMMNTLHLLWIIPAAYITGWCFGAVFRTGKEEDDD
jgi:hypothetical protein